MFYPSSNDVNNLIDWNPLDLLNLHCFYVYAMFVLCDQSLNDFIYTCQFRKNITYIPIHFREQFHVYGTFCFQDMTKKLILDV